MAITWRAAGSRPRVSEPNPGPTSSTTSSGSSAASDTMRRTVPASVTKFWPSRLDGRTSSCRARSRISPGPSSVSSLPRAEDALAGRLDDRAQLGHVQLLDRRERAQRVHHLDRGVGLAPVGHRGQERGVGLDQQGLGRRDRGGVAQRLGVLERQRRPRSSARSPRPRSAWPSRRPRRSSGTPPGPAGPPRPGCAARRRARPGRGSSAPCPPAWRSRCAPGTTPAGARAARRPSSSPARSRPPPAPAVRARAAAISCRTASFSATEPDTAPVSFGWIATAA